MKVKVWSGESHADSGMLVEVDDRWLVLEQPDGQKLYFSLPCVRLVKPIREP